MTSVEALRAEIIRKRDSKIEAAKADADRALGALNIVADILREADDTVEADTETPPAPTTTPRWGQPRKALPTSTWVAEIVNSLNGSTISQPVVFQKLMDEHAADFADRDAGSLKGQIAMILKKMEVKGQLIVTKQAYASEPTEYRRRTVPVETPVKVTTPKED
jgi:hypothetical protein